MRVQSQERPRRDQRNRQPTITRERRIAAHGYLSRDRDDDRRMTRIDDAGNPNAHVVTTGRLPSNLDHHVRLHFPAPLHLMSHFRRRHCKARATLAEEMPVSAAIVERREGTRRMKAMMSRSSSLR
jgi:hypothetical protein